MKRTLTLLLTATSIAITTAQNWTVGVPVNFQLTEVNLWGGGCFPTADQTFYIDPSAVSGIQHIAIVSAVTPPGVNTVVPGPPSPLSVGDTIILTGSGARSVYFPTGTGTLDLKIFAVGTPTTAGQVHPCVYNTLWISNLGICPEALSHNLSTTCTVQPGGVGIAEPPVQPSIEFPSALNGWRLWAEGAARLDVVDATGSTIMTSTGNNADANGLVSGVYFARITGSDGDLRTLRFTITR